MISPRQRLILFLPMGLLLVAFALSVLGLLWSSMVNGGPELYIEIGRAHV